MATSFTDLALICQSRENHVPINTACLSCERYPMKSSSFGKWRKQELHIAAVFGTKTHEILVEHKSPKFTGFQI